MCLIDSKHVNTITAAFIFPGEIVFIKDSSPLLSTVCPLTLITDRCHRMEGHLIRRTIRAADRECRVQSSLRRILDKASCNGATSPVDPLLQRELVPTRCLQVRGIRFAASSDVAGYLYMFARTSAGL